MPRLEVDLVANVASLQRDMNKAVGIVERSMADLRRAGAAVGGVFATLGVAFTAREFVSFVKSQVDAADALDKLSAKVDISVEKLSAYQYAAKLSGVSNEELTNGLVRLGKSVGEALSNPTSEAAEAFRNLGLSAKELEGRSLESIFEAVAPKVAGITDEVIRLQYQNELLGKSGYELQPLIANLGDLTREAERAGAVVSTEFANQADTFGDNMDRMQASLGKFARGIAMDALPALNEFLERLNVLQGSQERLSIQTLNRERERIVKEIEALRARTWEPNTLREQILWKQLEEVATAIETEEAKLNKLKVGMVGGVSGTETPAALGAAARARAAAAAEATAANDDGTVFGKDIEAEIDERIKKREEMYAREDALYTQQLENFAIKNAEAMMTDQELQTQRYEQKQIMLEDAWMREIIIDEQYRAQTEQLELEHQARMGNIWAQAKMRYLNLEKQSALDQAKFTTDKFVAMTAMVATSSKKMFQINKIATIAGIALRIPETVADAFTWGNKIGGPVLGAATAAIALGAQMAQLQQARSASFDGSTSAPSIAGGQAIQVAPVDVPTQPQVSQPRNVTIRVDDSTGLLDLWVREKLAPALTEALGDGAIKFT